VNSAREHLLAGAALADEGDDHVLVGHLADHPIELTHRRRLHHRMDDNIALSNNHEGKML